jgi:penicillin-binding protein 1A
VQSAARTYFSLDAARLTVPQAALLAGLVQAPTGDDPFTHPKAALARRAVVLARMARQGHLTRAQLAAAMRAPLGLRPGSRGRTWPAAWFVRWVTDQLLDPADHRFDALGTSRQERERSVFAGGLRVTTTVDLGVQAAAERAVRGVLDRSGDPYAALVAVEPGSGAVRAMVGGRDWFHDPRFGRVNLATGAGGTGRQAGSAFKTFALVAALERGVPPEAIFPAPHHVTLARSGAPPYQVGNYEGEGFSNATLREATALSINTVYAELLLRLGGGDPDAGARVVVDTAARMGVDASPLVPLPSAVLGANSVTPLELAGAYATLAAGGRHAAPYGVQRIVDASGRVLYQARPAAAPVVQAPVAALADDVLRGVVEHGTGVGARIGRPAAGKTGTTQNNADAWFVGYTPQLAAAVWVGFPQGEVPMQPPRTRITVLGGTWPAAIWARFMGAALAGRPPAGFPAPTAEVVRVAVDVRRNCLPNRFTPAAEVTRLVFLKGGEPTRTCAAPAGPVAGVVPAVVGLPLTEALPDVDQAGFPVRQVLTVSGTRPPGTVLAQSPLGGLRPRAGTVVTLTVAVDGHGVGGQGQALVPQLLGVRDADASALVDRAGLVELVTEGCDADPAAAAASPGVVWKVAPAPGTQVASGQQVQVWVNPSGCAAATPTPGSPAAATSTSRPPQGAPATSVP